MATSSSDMDHGALFLELMIVVLFPSLLLGSCQCLSISGPFTRVNSGEGIILSTEFDGGGLHASGKMSFSFGFFPDSAGLFTLAVYSSSEDETLTRVWAASSDSKVALKVPENATLQLDSGGSLMLFDAFSEQMWSSDTSQLGVVGLKLLQTGNLVLYDTQNKHVWQSFHSPLDVLLPGQSLSNGMHLTNGKFYLSLEDHALVLYSGSLTSWIWSLKDDDDDDDDADTKGSLCRNYCRHFLHSLDFRTDGIHLITRPTITTTSIKDLPSKQGCSCSSSAAHINPLRVMQPHFASALRLTEQGTLHVYVRSPAAIAKSPRRLGGIQIPSLEQGCFSPWYCDYCTTCMNGDNCICSSNDAKYTKIQSWAPGSNVGVQKKRTRNIILGVLLSGASIALLSSVCATRKPQSNKLAVSNKSVQEALRDSVPEEFSFRTLRKITNNFSLKLGDGGFGLVYEGLFKDKTKVAVKVLDRTSTQGEKEFRAEVTMMASTRHMNVMHLRGFCAEKLHRLLVYDYMPNASLDKWLFSPTGRFSMLDWVTRFNIAIGTSRGLAYLHEECTRQIIHLDVKPENILLDENFVPKVADFGLSKLIDREKSRVVTNTRGTPGYLAPEWVQRSSVTAKVDVYSFGIVLLELVCGRETIDMSMGSEQWYLPAWAVRMVEEGKALEIVDQRIREEVQFFFEEQGKRVIRVALCCIQEDPAVRPVMSRVVQMLEGVVEPRAPSVTRVSAQPTAARLKDKLKAYVEAISDGYTHAVTMDPSRGTKENGQNGVDDVGIIVASGHAVLKVKTGPSIPPWPLKGDVVLVRGIADRSLHAVVRDVRVRVKQVKFAFLCKMEDSEPAERWGVQEEETVWRQWNVMVRTMEFWIPVRWSTLPQSGSEKFPVEWLVK